MLPPLPLVVPPSCLPELGRWLRRVALPATLVLSTPALGASRVESLAHAGGDNSAQATVTPDAGPASRTEDILKRANAGAAAKAKEDAGDAAAAEDASSSSTSPSQGKPPVLQGRSTQVTIDFVDTPITDLVKYFAEITGRNFLLTDDLKGKVTIISHRPVSVGEAYEAFLSALESAGYTTVKVGQLTKVVSTNDAANSPVNEYYQGNIPYTDNYVTQIIQLDNVSVGDVSSVVKGLAGSKAKVIAYSPTNTLIITDSAVNIRRVYRIVSQLDVAAPRANLRIFPIQHAQAAEVQKVIQEIYGGDSTDKSTTNNSSSSNRRNLSSSRRSSRRSKDSDSRGSGDASSTTVGKEGSFIEKIISDERTNSIIVLANDAAMAKIQDLVAELDIDVDPQSRAQIRVVYLEHAKAEDVAQVLSNLSESGNSSSNNSRINNSRNSRNSRTGARGAAPPGAQADANTTGTVAALDGGVRITSDENTNSLVIVATPDQFEILKQVIDKLDIRRKQVFVQAVILEMASDDSRELGLGLHGGVPGTDGDLTIGSGQFGGSSLGLSTASLSGLALGIYGKPVTVTVPNLTDGTTSELSIPAFGIALNALATNTAINIVATPEIMTMDNEEAKIIVGRNIPFPVTSGVDNNNNPLITYQREDVATTLKVTPQINESNYVTLELFQEVTEVEADNSGLDVTTAGFITSKRSAETTVVVKDNQTVVIGGLIGSTENKIETKFPILGDLPLIGKLFRGESTTDRKTNLLIFLTPHIIEEPADLEEVYRIKWAQREEFIRRFYGKSRDQQETELASLLQYSMNRVDEPSPWRTKLPHEIDTTAIGVLQPAGTVIDDASHSMGDPVVEPDQGDQGDDGTIPIDIPTDNQ